MDLSLKVTKLILVLVAYTPQGSSPAAGGPLANATCSSDAEVGDVVNVRDVASMSSLIMINGLLCLLAYYWRCFANNYLHWAALATWALMNLQSMIKK